MIITKQVIQRENTDVLFYDDITPSFNGVVLLMVNNTPVKQVVCSSGLWYFMNNLIVSNIKDGYISLQELLDHMKKEYPEYDITIEVIEYA